MLNTLRGAVNNIFVKALLIIVALAFAIFGVGDVIRGRNDFDIVKFTNLPNITLSEFHTSKKLAINQLQSVTKEPITQEYLQQLDLDNQILNHLIKKTIVGAWIKDSRIVVGDKLVADSIKENPRFHDEKKIFSVNIFKNFLAHLSIPEEEFFSDVKFEIGKDTLEKITKKSIYMPKILQDIMVDFLSEKRTAKLIKVKLDEKANLSEKFNFSDDQINKFYEENKEIFRTPEERKVRYVTIERKLSKNSSEQETSDKEFMEEVQKLEDLVAGGDSLDEIAKKYNLKTDSISGSILKYEDNKILGRFAEQIFSMNESEISYPSEINDGNAIVLFMIDSIKESFIKPFKEVKTQVTEELLKKTYRDANIAKLNSMLDKAKDSKFDDLVKEYGYTTSNVEITRSERNNDLPDLVLVNILNNDIGNISDLILYEDYAYIVNVSAISKDKKQAEIIQASQMNSISHYYQKSFLDNIVDYFYQKNQPDVRTGLLRSDG